MQILFVASLSPIVRDTAVSHAFYRRALELPFEGSDGDYIFTERLDGIHHLGLWPLSEAARACFGSPHWPADSLVPQASIELAVGSIHAVEAAASELTERGYQLLHNPRTEPWGQTITRLLGPEGLIIGVCYTPWFHEQAQADG